MIRLKFVHYLIYVVVLFSNLSILVVFGSREVQSYPFFVLVGKFDDTCGGVLINPDTVLTAANCLYDRKRNQWPRDDQIYILFGHFEKEWNVKYCACDKYKVHANFNPNVTSGPVPYDIALIRLQSRIGKTASKYFARPCRFNLANARNRYQFGILVGLFNEYAHIKPRMLMDVVMQKYETCGRYDEIGYHINTTHQICYNVPDSSSSYKCDLGNPLFHREEENYLCLLGIVSFTFTADCHYPDYPIVFTSVATFANWIRRTSKLLKALS